MFITDQDYKVVIGEQALKVVSQVSQQNRDNAETEAVEEISSYLRPKYDVQKIFATVPDGSPSGEDNDHLPRLQPLATVPDGSPSGEDNRNRLIVMYTCDIALYHMTASAPQKMGMEIRKERYERAIKWLEGVQAGIIVPDLPLATDENGNPVGFPMVYGCQKKLRHNW